MVFFCPCVCVHRFQDKTVLKDKITYTVGGLDRFPRRISLDMKCVAGVLWGKRRKMCERTQGE